MCQLMIQGVTKASGLIAALNRIRIRRSRLALQPVDKLEHIFVVRSTLDIGEDPYRNWHCCENNGFGK